MLPYRLCLSITMPIITTKHPRIAYAVLLLIVGIAILLRLSGPSPTDYNLGLKYLNGQGVAKDEGQAAILFRKAADQGSQAAQDALRRLYEPANSQTVSVKYRLFKD